MGAGFKRILRHFVFLPIPVVPPLLHVLRRLPVQWDHDGTAQGACDEAMRQEQIGADIEIRPFEQRDYDAIVAVGNAVFPDRPTTVDELRYDDEHVDQTKYMLERYVAEEARPRMVLGYAEVRHMPWNFHPRKFAMAIRVRPDRWGRGIGSGLWNRLQQLLRARDALSVRTVVKEDHAAAVRFVQNRGFTSVLRTWESHLDVASCDLAPFAPDIARAKAAGVMVRTLGAELATDPACLRRVHALDMELGADLPLPDPFTPVEFDLWRAHGVDAPWFIPDAYFLAVCDGQYVGISALWKPKVGDWLHQGLTGVKREYRGRGIATTLKVQTVEHAKTHRCRQIRTENEVHNTRMIAINDRFGFQRQPPWITYLKALTG